MPAHPHVLKIPSRKDTCTPRSADRRTALSGPAKAETPRPHKDKKPPRYERDGNILSPWAMKPADAPLPEQSVLDKGPASPAPRQPVRRRNETATQRIARLQATSEDRGF